MLHHRNEISKRKLGEQGRSHRGRGAVAPYNILLVGTFIEYNGEPALPQCQHNRLNKSKTQIVKHKANTFVAIINKKTCFPAHNINNINGVLKCTNLTTIVLVNVALLIKLKESPLCQQIGLKRNLFVGKLGLCTPPLIFFSLYNAIYE